MSLPKASTLKIRVTRTPCIQHVRWMITNGPDGELLFVLEVRGDEDTAGVRVQGSTVVMPTEAEVKASRPRPGRIVIFEMEVEPGDTVHVRAIPYDRDEEFGQACKAEVSVVSGNLQMPTAPPPQHPNCRCIVAPSPSDDRGCHVIDGFGPP